MFYCMFYFTCDGSYRERVKIIVSANPSVGLHQNGPQLYPFCPNQLMFNTLCPTKPRVYIVAVFHDVIEVKIVT